MLFTRKSLLCVDIPKPWECGWVLQFWASVGRFRAFTQVTLSSRGIELKLTPVRSLKFSSSRGPSFLFELWHRFFKSQPHHLTLQFLLCISVISPTFTSQPSSRQSPPVLHCTPFYIAKPPLYITAPPFATQAPFKKQRPFTSKQYPFKVQPPFTLEHPLYITAPLFTKQCPPLHHSTLLLHNRSLCITSPHLFQCPLSPLHITAPFPCTPVPFTAPPYLNPNPPHNPLSLHPGLLYSPPCILVPFTAPPPCTPDHFTTPNCCNLVPFTAHLHPSHLHSLTYLHPSPLHYKFWMDPMHTAIHPFQYMSGSIQSLYC